MAYVFPALFALGIWWFSTGIILALGRWTRKTPLLGLVLAGLIAIAAFAWIIVARGADHVYVVYASFTAAILIWGWHELAFLSGFVTGPRKQHCPEGATGLIRFRYAFETVLFHEFALLVTAMAIAFATLGAVDLTALGTFTILWLMRISAKLNLYFGAPNASTDMLPDQLNYLKSYFGKGSVGLCFALTVTLATLAFAYFVAQAAFAQEQAKLVQASLYASLLALAILEHWFFVLNFNEASLWHPFKKRASKIAEKTSTAGQPLRSSQTAEAR